MSHKIGPVIIDIAGTHLDQEERELLQHPQVGGVILFSRNFSSVLNLAELCKEIRQSCPRPIYITVDQEGGRVQRFQEEFTRLPTMQELGLLYEKSPRQAQQWAEDCGWLMAAELLSVNIDLSFAPVLDLAKEINPAIGNRSFHRDPNKVSQLAKALIKGMHMAGMAATGKHFPGHGSVTQDSHEELPIDPRPLEAIQIADLIPFLTLIQSGLDAIMSSHIVFPAIDHAPAGFSHVWLQDLLRKKYQFDGLIFSDDINMKATHVLGDFQTRAELALNAGCNMILICNNRGAAINILDRLPRHHFVENRRFKKLQGKFSLDFKQLRATSRWQETNQRFQRFFDKEMY